MNPEDIAKVLDEIGERVGPLGSAAWDILVGGTWAVSLVGTLIGLIILIVGPILAVVMYKRGTAIPTKTDPYYGERRTDSATFMMVAGWVTGPLSLIVGLLMVGHSAVGVIAPEFRVLENMLTAIAGR